MTCCHFCLCLKSQNTSHWGWANNVRNSGENGRIFVVSTRQKVQATSGIQSFRPEIRTLSLLVHPIGPSYRILWRCELGFTSMKASRFAVAVTWWKHIISNIKCDLPRYWVSMLHWMTFDFPIHWHVLILRYHNKFNCYDFPKQFWLSHDQWFNLCKIRINIISR